MNKPERPLEKRNERPDIEPRSAIVSSANPSGTAASQTDSEPHSAAVALAYRTGQSAPKVVARGRGLIAKAIIAEARAHGIYVHESPELVSLLMQVDLDQHIPPELYIAVA